MLFETRDIRRYATEHAFYRAIMDYNELGASRGGRAVFTTEARHLNEQYRRELIAQVNSGVDWVDAHVAACKAVLDERLGQDYTRADAERAFDDFRDMTRVDWRRDTEAQQADGRVPISPFDSRFAFREAVYDRGAQETFVDTRATDAQGIPASMLHDKLSTMRLQVCNSADRERDPEPLNRYLTAPSDLSGIAMLKPYILDAEEYQACRDSAIAPWWSVVNTNRFEGDEDLPEKEAYANVRAALEDAEASARLGRAVLADLAADGREYHVNPEWEGQVEVTDTLAKMSMRLLDRPGYGQYVGRLRDLIANVSYQARSSESVSRDSNKRKDVALIDEDPQLAVNAMRWAGGRRTDIGPLGTVGRGDASLRYNGITRHASYYAASEQRTNVTVGQLENGHLCQMHSRKYGGYRVDHLSFAGDEPARNRANACDYIKNAVEEARRVYEESVDLDGLIAFDQAHRNAGERDGSEPDFVEGAINDTIVALRSELWDELAVDSSGVSAREYLDDYLEADVGTYEEYVDSAGDTAVRASFNILGVSNYAEEGSSVAVRTTLVNASRTLGLTPQDFVDERGTMSEGESRQVNRVQGFDIENNARSLNDMLGEGTFEERCLNAVYEALQDNMMRVSPDNVLIDGNGIICWQAERANGDSAANYGKKLIEVTGELGPVFSQTEFGTYLVDREASRSFELAPNIRGWVAPTESAPGTGVFGENGRLRGATFADDFEAAIRSQINKDVRVNKSAWRHVGDPYSLESVWYAAEGKRYPLDGPNYEPNEAQIEPSLHEARLRTEVGRVTFGKEVDRAAGVLAYLSNGGVEMRDANRFNDNDGSMMRVMGNPDPSDDHESNWAITPEVGDGLFDRWGYASASAMMHTRTLCEGATLHPDGPPEYARDADGNIDVDAHSPLVNHEVFENIDHNMWNRGVIAEQNVSDGLGVADGVNIAIMDCGGWGMEDGIPISKEFAETHQVRDDNGNLRPLGPGDKLSPVDGNKGVVSIVVDRNMPQEEAMDKGIGELWATFKLNPELDVIMSPYSLVSRGNAGSIREMLDSDKKIDLCVPNGSDLENITRDNRVIENGISKARMIIHNKTFEAKTNPDSDRKFGWQMVGVLHSLGCDELLSEVYGQADRNVEFVSEVMRCINGTQLDELGNITQGEGIENMGKPVHMPNINKFLDGTRKSFNTYRAQFRQRISNEGGFLPVPFAAKFPTIGTWAIDPSELPDIEGVNWADKLGADYDAKGRPTGKFRVELGGGDIPEIPKEKWAELWPELVDADGESHNPWGMVRVWAYPVMDSRMRAGFVTDADEQVHHGYTRSYSYVYSACAEYARARNEWLAEAHSHPELAAWNTQDHKGYIEFMAASMGRDEDRAFYVKQHPETADLMTAVGEKGAAINKAKESFRRSTYGISEDIASDMLDGKWNIAKSHMMTCRAKAAPNAIWSPNPQLDIDQVAVSPHLADKMGVHNDDTLVVWRSPDLEEGCEVALKVKVDENIYGLAVHPGLAAIIKGDFDGDTVGAYKPKRKSAIREVNEKLSPGRLLLDFGAEPKDGMYPLKFGLSGDTGVGLARKPELKARLDELTKRVNEEAKFPDAKARKANLVELNKIVHEATDHEFGTCALSFTDEASLIRSMAEEVVAPGHKGDPAKLALFGRAVGCTFNEDAIDMKHGTVDVANLNVQQITDDKGNVVSGLTREDMTDVQIATALKQSAVGSAGKSMQYAIGAFAEKPEVLRASLRVIEDAYQGILDYKNAGAYAMECHPYAEALLKAYDGERIDMGELTATVANGEIDELPKDKAALKRLGVKSKPSYRKDGKPMCVETVDEYCAQVEVLNTMLDRDDYSRDDVRLMAQTLFDQCKGNRDQFGLKPQCMRSQGATRLAFSEDRKDFALMCAGEEHLYSTSYMEPLRPRSVRLAQDARRGLAMQQQAQQAHAQAAVATPQVAPQPQQNKIGTVGQAMQKQTGLDEEQLRASLASRDGRRTTVVKPTTGGSQGVVKSPKSGDIGDE